MKNAHKTAIWSAGGVLLVGLWVVAAVFIFQRTQKASDERQRISVVLDKANVLLSELRDAETGQHGYLLTGNEAFLEPYWAAKNDIKDNLEKLQHLAKISEAHEKVDALTPLVDGKLKEMARVIELRRNQGLPAAIAVLVDAHGSQLMDSIRALTGDLIRIEEAALTQRDARLQSEMSRMFAIVVSASLFTLLFAYLAVYVIAHKQAEAALRTSERKLQSVFEQTAVGMVIAEGSRGRFLKVNRHFCEMVGYSAGELLQMTPRDITHPDDIAADTHQLAQVNSEIAREFSREKRYRKKDGTCLWAKTFIAPLDPAEAKPTLQFGVIANITELKQAEAALRQSEERYRVIFDHNPFPMWLIDPATLRFLAVNVVAVSHYGYTPEEFLAMTLKDIHPPEDIPALLKFLKEEPAESTRSCDSRHRRKDGTIMRVEAVFRPLMFGDREARLVLAADVTEKKLLEEKFNHAQRLESIGMLATGIAHDLNNVLSPFVFAAPLLRGSLTSPRDLKILDDLEQSAARGARLVKQVLGVAHATTGEHQPTQVKHLARDIIALIEATFPKSIQFEHHIPADLWPVQGRATQIHQVLLNLCVNARDAMPSGGILRLVAANRRLSPAEAAEIPGGQPGAWLVLEVTDTGTGIAPEALEHIWTPFFTTKAEGKGTGLGLSTVRSIVLNHHGFFELDTEVGVGTTFRIFLPTVESDAPRSGSAAPFAILDGHNELILVADDDKVIREMIAEILGDHGYRVLVCADGVDALTLINHRSGGISLVITDADMPRLHGVALARAVRQMRPDIQLLAISGLSPSDAAGPDLPVIRELTHAFLAKPFTPDEMLGAVHRLLHPPKKA